MNISSQAKTNDVILYSNYDIIDEKSRLLKRVQISPPAPEHFRYSLMTKTSVHGCSVLLPKSCFEKHGLFDESLRTTQDYDKWFQLSKYYSFVHVPKSTIQSRSHSGQGTRTMSELHVSECNKLLINFLNALTPEEIIFNTTYPLGTSYAKIAFNFRKRGYFKASGMALKLSQNHYFNQPVYARILTLYLYKKISFLDLIFKRV